MIDLFKIALTPSQTPTKPKDPRKTGRDPKYPWAKIRVGKEFRVPRGNYKSIQRIANYQKHKYGREFEVSVTKRGTVVCVRIK